MVFVSGLCQTRHCCMSTHIRQASACTRCTQVDTQTHIHVEAAHTQVSTHMLTHTLTHTHVHTLTYTYTHTHARICAHMYEFTRRLMQYFAEVVGCYVKVGGLCHQCTLLCFAKVEGSCVMDVLCGVLQKWRARVSWMYFAVFCRSGGRVCHVCTL